MLCLMRGGLRPFHSMLSLLPTDPVRIRRYGLKRDRQAPIFYEGAVEGFYMTLYEAGIAIVTPTVTSPLLRN
jgi:hypothetical protein